MCFYLQYSVTPSSVFLQMFWCLITSRLSTEIICVLESSIILHGEWQLGRNRPACFSQQGRTWECKQSSIQKSEANFGMLKSALLAQVSFLVESGCAAADRNPWLAIISSKRVPPCFRFRAQASVSATVNGSGIWRGCT